MLCQNETGVLPGSELFFSTIGSTTRRLFYYINSCGHYYCERGYKIRRGSIGNLLLMYIEAGTMHVEFDGHSYDAHAGDIILMDCTLPQYYGTPDYVEFFWMHILGVNSFELCEYLTRARGVVHRTASNEKNAVLIRRLLAEFKNDQPVPDSERSSVLHTIFCNLMPDANKQESAQSETPAHTAARFIESHLSEPLSLQRLASLVNLSPSHLIRLFQQEFHHSPHEYIILARMNHAKYLLKTTSKPVKAIALEVGYRTESSFTNAFTEKVGISPRRFREVPLG